MQKYSRQRESIKNFLADRYDHPTAETVYLHMREQFPNISLGTVYRNLNLLTEIGVTGIPLHTIISYAAIAALYLI